MRLKLCPVHSCLPRGWRISVPTEGSLGIRTFAPFEPSSPLAPVRLHPNARLLRDKRGGRHGAVVAKLPDQPIEPVSSRPRLVAKRQLMVFGRKFGDELARRRFRGVDLAEIANVPATTILRDRNRIASTLTYRFRRKPGYAGPRLALLV